MTDPRSPTPQARTIGTAEARPPSLLLTALLAPRRTPWLLGAAAILGLLYVLLTFDAGFLLGRGPFWAFPQGPWLMDSRDLVPSIDLIDSLIGYIGFLHSPWTLPIFYVPAIGTPAGTNVMFMGVVPIAALLGRIASAATGHFILPDGIWLLSCFVLSAVCAAWLMTVCGQRSLLAAIAASLLAVSAPTLLHRFGHPSLMAHFLVIGALCLYVKFERAPTSPNYAPAWAAWLGLGLFINAYIFGMAAAIFAASLLRRWRRQWPRPALLEPICIGAVLVGLLYLIGYVGPGTGSSPSAGGFGAASMNLLSPFWPQRSGLFPGTEIQDGTGVQYEGFSYLGAGALALGIAVLATKPEWLLAQARRHAELCIILALLTAFALSNVVFLGPYRLFAIELGPRLEQLVGVYRSSGRMFWPAYYALMFGFLLGALRFVNLPWQVGLTVACCALQLADAEPLRERLTYLTTHPDDMLLKQSDWSDRIDRARVVEIYPTFWCSAPGEPVLASIELQLFAVRADRPFNSVYNSRLQPDCRAERDQLMAGPWSPETLYILLAHGYPGAGEFIPPGLACHRFAYGTWCFGPNK